ncbi:DUF4123 domain-containing protein [uncultured Shewanella sp.]|uniref:DUF4123 domain-containing protein n=1 Tax=uncultured Shewanella sp. TaxID=173975 RepID=UPI002636D970|nr:DUF4123 domain-containing protein [uncultured Shewanella sp.]
MIIDELTLTALTEHAKETCYLLLDGSKIDKLEQKLYQFLENPNYEPVYLFEPWNALREVGPCLVQINLTADLDKRLLGWFIQSEARKHGYIFSSLLPLEEQAESLRSYIQVLSPYKSKVIYKQADPEVAWRLMSIDTGFLWLNVERAWIPITPPAFIKKEGQKECQKEGQKEQWHYLENPRKTINPIQQEEGALWRLTDAQWALLGEVSYQNLLAKLHLHVQQWFPELAKRLQQPQNERGPNEKDQDKRNMRFWADFAKRKGFSQERDLYYFFNLLGYLGEAAVLNKQYSDIEQLLSQPCQLTPSQRIALAAEKAEAISGAHSDEKVHSDEKAHSDEKSRVIRQERASSSAQGVIAESARSDEQIVNQGGSI